MSLKPSSIDPVPDEIARVAQAAFPNGNQMCVYERNWASSRGASKLLALFRCAASRCTDDPLPDLFPWRANRTQAPGG